MAYQVLRDPIKRRDYDASLGLLREPDPPSRSSPLAHPLAAMARASAKGRSLRQPVRPDVLVPSPAPAVKPEFNRRPIADPTPTPTPEADTYRSYSPRLAIGEASASDLNPIKWKQTGIALGAIVVAACALGGLAGWWSVRAVDEPQQPKVAAVASLPDAAPIATIATPQFAPAPAPVRSAPDARPIRPQPVPAVAPPADLEPATADEQSQESLAESQRDPSSSGQVADEAPTISPAAASMPLPNRVIARTIDRIGYSCGRVASTVAVGAPGAYKVNCASGQSYQAKPVNGRYHFRRWSK